MCACLQFIGFEAGFALKPTYLPKCLVHVFYEKRFMQVDKDAAFFQKMAMEYRALKEMMEQSQLAKVTEERDALAARVKQLEQQVSSVADAAAENAAAASTAAAAAEVAAKAAATAASAAKVAAANAVTTAATASDAACI